MARIVLVMICGALVFILVSKFAPHFLETYVPASTWGSSTSPAEADKSKPASTAKKAPASKSRSGGAAKSAETASTETLTTEPENRVLSAGSAMVSVPGVITPAEPGRRVARVTAENATLYLTNTTGGPVVGRLAKGAVVEPVFVVSSAGQNWTFVSANEVTGFLRSETLAKAKAADPLSR